MKQLGIRDQGIGGPCDGRLGIPLVPDRLVEVGIGLPAVVDVVESASKDDRSGTDMGQDVGDGPLDRVGRELELLRIETLDDVAQALHRGMQCRQSITHLCIPSFS